MATGGYTIDPNREDFEPKWWDELGATTSPSPYATKSWVYRHDITIQDDHHIFATVEVYDSLASNPSSPPLWVEEELPPYTEVAPMASASAYDEDNYGVVLGHLSYEVVGPLLTLTDWGHYNWHDATPVRKAWNALRYNLPECIQLVAVRDEPHAFWTDLDFYKVDKDPGMLFYQKPYYRRVAY